VFFIFFCVFCIIFLIGFWFFIPIENRKFEANLRQQITSFFSIDKKISITSEIENISPSISDEKYISTLLEEIDFWEGEKKIYETKKRIYSEIKHLKIILTSKEQQFNKVVKKNTSSPLVYQSAGVEYDYNDQSIILYLHLDKSSVESLTESELEQVFSYMAIKRLFGIKNDVQLSQDVDYAKKSKPFIEIKKYK